MFLDNKATPLAARVRLTASYPRVSGKDKAREEAWRFARKPCLLQPRLENLHEKYKTTTAKNLYCFANGTKYKTKQLHLEA